VRNAIHLPANDVLERSIEDLVTRPRGRSSYAPLVRYRSFAYQAASWDRPRRVIAQIEHHLGWASSLTRSRGRAGPSSASTTSAAADQGGQSRQPLDAPLLSPLPGQRGLPPARGHRLQPRQSPAPARLPVAIQSWSLTSLQQRLFKTQDQWAPHPACSVLRPLAGRRSLDWEPLSADPRAHRATRVASDVIGRTARAKSKIDAGGSVSAEGGHGRQTL
jgi:Transposase DDE domain group 1